ncbi:MAG TPA: hypothetical protein VF490_20355, partial [Chryseosolibacter sp.]
MFFISTRSWSTKILVIVIAFLACSFPLRTSAQISQTDRFEVPIEARSEFFDVVPTTDHGLVLYRQFSGLKEDQVQLIKLDTAFDEDWSGFLPVRKNYRLMAAESFGQKLYLLLRYKDFSKNDLIVYAVEEATGHYVRFEIRGYIPFAPTEFRITEQAAIIGGYYNRIPVVLHFSFSELRSKVLPGLFNESGELTQIKTNDDG